MLPVLGAEFLKSAKLFSSSECLAKPGPVPRAPGVYGWYFKSLPPGVANGRCERRNGLFLLYVGIAPKARIRYSNIPPTGWQRQTNDLHGGRGASDFQMDGRECKGLLDGVSRSMEGGREINRNPIAAIECSGQ